jgi:hypothetical protein
MKTKLLVLMALAGGTLFGGTHVSIGVAVGGPGYYPPPPPAVVYAEPAPVYVEPPCPGPGYTWVTGYYYYSGPRRLWRAGYWAPPRHHGWGPGWGPANYRRDFHDRGRWHDGDRGWHGRDRGGDHDRGWHGRGHDRERFRGGRR